MIRANLLTWLFGLIFGFGLIVAQMINPAKIQAFLDIAGDWDPSMAWVMASALLVLGGAQRLLRLTSETGSSIDSQSGCAHAPAIDWQLLAGSAIFGVGWGLSGICPGPALVGLASGFSEFYIFATAMFVGFYYFRYLKSLFQLIR